MFVGRRVEYVLVGHGGLSFLSAAPDQFDPVVQILRHIRGLQRLSHLHHELVGTLLRVGWKVDVMDGTLVLVGPEIPVVQVEEQLGQRVELRSYFTDILGVIRGVLERAEHIIEESVGHVVLALSLQLDAALVVGL